MLYERAFLQKFNVPRLIFIARQLGVKRATSLKKGELIDAILSVPDKPSLEEMLIKAGSLKRNNEIVTSILLEEKLDELLAEHVEELKIKILNLLREKTD